VKYNKVH